MNEISRFVLFEVGRANVGDARHRPTTSELLQGWNARVEGSGIGFVGAVGHTGNYIVETGTSTSLADLTRAINLLLHIRVAAFDALHFAQIVAAARNVFGAPATVPSGRRPTAGLVMDLNAEGDVLPRPPGSERLMFADFAAPRVRGVWKLDVLRPDGKALDRTKREGGWGSVSKVMSDFTGGEWNRLVLKLPLVKRT
jgi:hypothetical protein